MSECKRCESLSKCFGGAVKELSRASLVIQTAIEVAYDPGKQPALVLALIEEGYIDIEKSEASDFPRLPS